MTRGAFLILALVISACCLTGAGAEPGKDGERNLTAAHLEDNKALDQIVAPPDTLLAAAEKGINVTAEVLSLIHKTTHVPLLVITRAAIPPQTVAEMHSHPVRDILLELAKNSNSAWQRYESIFALAPSGIEPNSARPIALTNRFPEFKRKITGVYSDSALSTVLRRLSYWNRVDLGVYRRAGDRGHGAPFSLTPCTIAAEGTSVDEVMRALTAVSGDPWDHDNLYHVLCLSGDPLTTQDREKLIPSKSLSAFNRSVSEEQIGRMKGKDGLPLSALSRQQSGNLLGVIGSTLGQAGIDPTHAVLRIFGDRDNAITYGQMDGGRFVPAGEVTFR